MEKVSVIIPTFNRFKLLLNAIESVKKQTYKNFEIIVVNDKSTHHEYYDYDWDANNISIIHLEENSKQTFGYLCAGYVRNKGIEISTGKYVAFCHDTDIWFPKKLELQINAMKETGCLMASSDGLHGNGEYNPYKKYPLFNAELHYNFIRDIYRNNKSDALENGFPEIWTLDFLKIHNCVVPSSCVMEKELLIKINNMKHKWISHHILEDYDCWLRALEHTNCVYINDVCFYFDCGKGENYLGEYINSILDNVHVKNITKILNDVGERIEGNLICDIKPDNYDAISNNESKIKNLQYLCKNKKKIIEIGVNGCHSLLLMLLINPTAEYLLFDLGNHKYTIPALNYIKKQFAYAKINLILGNSVETIQEYIRVNQNNLNSFDLIHLDGGHTEDIFSHDYTNSKKLITDKGIIIFDDYNLGNIKNFIERKIKDNEIVELNDKNIIKNDKHFNEHFIYSYL